MCLIPPLDCRLGQGRVRVLLADVSPAPALGSAWEDTGPVCGEETLPGLALAPSA